MRTTDPSSLTLEFQMNHSHADRSDNLHSDCPACNVIRGLHSRETLHIPADAVQPSSRFTRTEQRQVSSPWVDSPLSRHLITDHQIGSAQVSADTAARQLLHISLHDGPAYDRRHFTTIPADLHDDCRLHIKDNPHSLARRRARLINEATARARMRDAITGIKRDFSQTASAHPASFSLREEAMQALSDIQAKHITPHRDTPPSKTRTADFVDNIEIALWTKHPVVLAEAACLGDNGEVLASGKGIACKRPEDVWNTRLGQQLATARALMSLGTTLERLAYDYDKERCNR
jgi:hypothetical protein